MAECEIDRGCGGRCHARLVLWALAWLAASCVVGPAAGLALLGAARLAWGLARGR